MRGLHVSDRDLSRVFPFLFVFILIPTSQTESPCAFYPYNYSNTTAIGYVKSDHSLRHNFSVT